MYLLFLSGDTDYGRREIRENWRERRKTGIISIDTEQDQFIIADNIAIGTSTPSYTLATPWLFHFLGYFWLLFRA